MIEYSPVLKVNSISLHDNVLTLLINFFKFLQQSLETQKLEQLQKDRERAQQVLQKAQEENTTFSKSTQEKLRRSLELNKENRQAQIKALQERLREHVSNLLMAL